MYVFTREAPLRSLIKNFKEHNVRIGFAPTMGALHDGHISLIKAINSREELSVASIFVNPKQFNEPSDLENYPRTLFEDLRKLEDAECDVVFVPDKDEIFPSLLDSSVELEMEDLSSTMEGVHRPGHFKGMVEVVNRLLHIVQAHSIYVGQKDYQQYVIIRRLCDQMHSDTEVRLCPIVRENSGLAMSSRNGRLSSEMKDKAAILYQVLKRCKEDLSKRPLAQIQQDALDSILNAGLEPEYFEIVDGLSLRALDESKKYKVIVACLAAWAGDVRLIDNMILFDNYHRV